MKETAFISFLLFLGTTTYCQSIKGTVYDAETKLGIPYAAIYINGTFVGTSSNEAGIFELDITKHSVAPLTIRAIGYETVVLESIPRRETIEVYLTPCLIEIDEVEVKTRDLSRQRKAYLRLFRREFLGTSRNKKHCHIINEEDITFNYGSAKDTLKAYARNPIQVYNGSLGYKVIAHLDQFEFNKKTSVVFYTADIVYTEDLAIKRSNDNPYGSRRKRTYLGSSMHFFRALWNNDLDAQGFKILKYAFNQSQGIRLRNIPVGNVRYEDMVKVDSDRKYLIASAPLTINYRSVDESTILFQKRRVLFGQNGFFDPSGILWYGYMGELRIADMLPYEYQPDH